MGNTLTDISFDCLPFLVEQEPIYNMKGQKVSKSYYDKSGREAVRLRYERIFKDYTYNNVVYSNVFIGLCKRIEYLDWSGEIAYTKNLQPYLFNLEPVFLGDGTETIVSFSSQKQREILRTERYKADDWLNAKNPNLYAMLYQRYTTAYNYYLRTGLKDDLVNEIDSEVNPEINTVFNNEVYGYEPMTVKELIILNLQ
ncbi:hypothetical protein [Flavobacterium geliluteum]|uniref:Uncharacterized protein n=1 Tax=Flavobacterium geliluteum TaxID=2816120 RepID=A0A941AYB8_9FLAO|nr:hypothetical protein [Flavobacterium geliluteum]MBP4140125.1 hypothetical protein [Flavobacterium geliluteum]